MNSTYGIAKQKASNYLIKSASKNSLRYIILRPFLIYGPGQSKDRLIPNTIINCLKNNKFPCSKGHQFRDFLYIDDFVDVIIRSINSKNVYNKVLNVGSGKPIRIKSVILNIQKIINKGTPLFGKIALRSDEPLRLYPNIKKIIKVLKWKPKKKMSIGLKKTIEYYKKTK